MSGIGVAWWVVNANLMLRSNAVDHPSSLRAILRPLCANVLNSLSPSFSTTLIDIGVSVAGNAEAFIVALELLSQTSNQLNSLGAATSCE